MLSVKIAVNSDEHPLSLDLWSAVAVETHSGLIRETTHINIQYSYRYIVFHRQH